MKRLVLIVLVMLATPVSATLMPGATVLEEYYANPFEVDISGMPSLSELSVDDPSDGIDWSYVELPHPCVSGLNSTTFIAVSKGTSKNLLIYLEGGGACTDYYTCGNTPYRTVTTLEPNFTRIQMLYRYGIFDRTNADNPFRDWTIVFVPYSTGDIHWGNRVVRYCMYDQSGVYPYCFEVHHVGFVNAIVAMRWAAAQGKFEKVVLAGSSAGGYGTIIHSYYAREIFGKGILAIDDAGPGISANYSRPMFMLEVVNETWGGYQNLPEDARKIMEGKDAIYFLDYVLKVYRDVRFALYEDQMDYTIGVLFNGYTEEEFRKILLTKSCEIKAKHRDNFFRYFPASNNHTILAYPWFYEKSIHNYEVYEWIKDLIKGKKREAVELKGISGIYLACPPMLFVGQKS